MLYLKINLIKKAKLSFWYANKKLDTGSTFFKINGITERTWETDVDWSFITVDLEAGENNIVWEKTDGYYYSDGFYYEGWYSGIIRRYYYLSLDDILIYYTE